MHRLLVPTDPRNALLRTTPKRIRRSTSADTLAVATGARRDRELPRSVLVRLLTVLSGKSLANGGWKRSGTWKRPGIRPGLACWFGVEPPAGIEPATPSLPWNHQEPLCGPPFPQVAPDRRGQSYRFCFGEVMRSPISRRLRGLGRRETRFPLRS